jgi:hypothetical protein
MKCLERLQNAVQLPRIIQLISGQPSFQILHTACKSCLADLLCHKNTETSVTVH